MSKRGDESNGRESECRVEISTQMGHLVVRQPLSQGLCRLVYIQCTRPMELQTEPVTKSIRPCISIINEIVLCITWLSVSFKLPDNIVYPYKAVNKPWVTGGIDCEKSGRHLNPLIRTSAIGKIAREKSGQRLNPCCTSNHDIRDLLRSMRVCGASSLLDSQHTFSSIDIT